MPNRREVLKGAAASASLIVCEAVAPAVAAAIAPTLGCGCPRIYKISFGHTCCIHDEKGRRWDSYTAEEVAALCGATLEPAQADWRCYCGRHEDNDLPIGAPCMWERTSYECDEAECRCAEDFRDDWLAAQTTDWIAMAEADLDQDVR